MLEQLANNTALCEAVKAHILSHFSLDDISTTVMNEQLGEIVRSRLEGKRVVEKAFRDIASMKAGMRRPDMPNPAR